MGSNIIISGTSFLLPKNEVWSVLGPTNKIIFSNYGDWRSPIKKCKKNEYLVFVIFISELYGISSASNKNDSKAVLDLVKVFLFHGTSIISSKSIFFSRNATLALRENGLGVAMINFIK